MRFLLLSVLFVLALSPAQAQLQNSGQMLNNANELYLQDNDSMAMELYNEVFMGDTNYVLAQLRAGKIAYELKKYSRAIEQLKRADQIPSPLRNEIYNLLALTYNQLKMNDSADYYISEGMRLFPVDPVLVSNKGYFLYARNDFKLSEEVLFKALDMNPFASNPHYFLGYHAAGQQHMVHALMAWGMYLLTTQNFKMLKEIEALSDGSFQIEEGFKPKAPYSVNDFESVDEKMLAKLPLNQAYKTKIKFDAALIKQYKYLLEAFNYDPNSTDTYMKVYGPFYAELKKQDLLEPFVRLLIGSMDSENNNKWLESNKKKTQVVIDLANAELRKIMDRQELIIQGKKVEAECWYNRQKIEALGEAENGDLNKRLGYWYIFASNGVLKAEGNYSSGKRSGIWKYYHLTGWLENEVEFVDDKKNGFFKQYYENGQLQQNISYKNDLAEGEAKFYHPCGALKKEVNFTANEQNGMEITYHVNGNLESKCRVVNGNYIDTGYTWYVSGQPALKLIYNDGKLNGAYEEFFENGKLMAKGMYKEGNKSGIWLYYHNNGRLRSTGNYNDKGEEEGEWRYYSEDGRKDRVLNFLAGELNGRQEYYDDKGVLRQMSIAQKEGKFVEEVRYNERGQEIGKFGNRNGNFTIESKNTAGRITMKGAYKNGFMDGTWVWYFPNGRVSKTAEYANGRKNGNEKIYSIEGALLEDNNYAEGSLEGVCTDYYETGKVRVVAGYKNGELEGRRVLYYSNGSLQEEAFFAGGEAQGIELNYNPDGKLSSKSLYNSTYGYATEQGFDINGRVSITSNPFTLKGTIQARTTNGDIRIEHQTNCGYLVGTSIFKNALGKTSNMSNYQVGRLHGTSQSYYFDGSERMTMHYTYGVQDSLEIKKYPNGNIEAKGRYHNGYQVGVWEYYHDNGKLDGKVHFDSLGQRQGWVRYYDMLGELIYAKFYSDGETDSIAWMDPSGKLGKAMAIAKDSVTLTTYFPNGKVSAIETFVNGKMSGKIQRFHSDGSVMESFTLLNRKLNGTFYYGYPGNKPRATGNSVSDDYHGRIVLYRKPGILFSEEEYNADMLDGEAIYYDTEGKQIARLKIKYHEKVAD